MLLSSSTSQVAAADEPRIREVDAADLRRALRAGRRASRGADAEELQAWFAHGMLINTMAAIGADQVDAPWARALTTYDWTTHGGR